AVASPPTRPQCGRETLRSRGRPSRTSPAPGRRHPPCPGADARFAAGPTAPGSHDIAPGAGPAQLRPRSGPSEVAFPDRIRTRRSWLPYTLATAELQFAPLYGRNWAKFERKLARIQSIRLTCPLGVYQGVSVAIIRIVHVRAGLLSHY